MRARPAGFTLIEIMMVVAIIGILASVAVPSFRVLQLRSRQSERLVMLQAIHNSVEDHFVRGDHFPGWDPATPTTSTLWLNNNPGVFAFTGQKQPWRYTSWGDHWNDLGLRVEGGLYFVYWGTGSQTGSRRQYWLVAQADLDQDGVVSTLQRLYSYEGSTLQHLAAVPPSANCSLQSEIPFGAF